MALRRSLAALAALLALAGTAGGQDLVDGPVIGIDLGTTYSCVGIFKNGQVEIIPNDQGNRITPSVVAFTAEGRLVGEAAKNQASLNPTQTLFDMKRIIGRPHSDAALRRDLDALPFKTVNVGEKVKMVVSVDGEEKRFEPEQISALVLGKLRAVAEQYLGMEVKHAVVTVPASFNMAQRQATKDAATLAGLTVMRIVSEPTAAAVAFGLAQGAAARTVLVYDLGGGTFDVSILKVDSGVFEVLASSGDARLGGEDFDRNVVQHFVKTFEKKHSAKLGSDPAVQQKLRKEAERVKRMLSSTPQAKFSVEALQDGLDLAGTLTRARFEEMNAELLKRTLNLMEKALKDAGIRKSDVDDVVLVGGSTRIPKVQQLVTEFFDGKEPARGINPDEAVAYGAAIQAAAFSSSAAGSAAAGALLLDVSPLTLGIETVGGVMTEVIARNTALPAKNSMVFTTHRDNQPALNIKVFEGERLLTKSNHLLGKFRLGGIGPAPRGTTQIEVSFEVDASGILSVSAEDKSSGTKQSLVVTQEGGRLSASQIETMLKEAEEFAEEDRQAKERADARTALEGLLLSVHGLAVGEVEGPSGEERDRLNTAIMEGKDWLASNLDAVADEIREKHAELEAVCGEISAQYGGAVGGGGGGGGGGGAAIGGPVASDDDMEGHDEL